MPSDSHKLILLETPGLTIPLTRYFRGTIGGEFGKSRMADATVLAHQLRDKQVEVRARAAEELSQQGEEARAAAVELVEACGDDESVSQWAVSALEQLGPPPTGSAEQLVRLTASDHELVSYWAVTLLGRLPEAADTAIPAVVTALGSSPHLSVRQRAAWALGQMGVGSEPVTTALSSAAQSQDARLSRMAQQALDQLK
jgi:HEAT repeat protein